MRPWFFVCCLHRQMVWKEPCWNPVSTDPLSSSPASPWSSRTVQKHHAGGQTTNSMYKWNHFEDYFTYSYSVYFRLEINKIKLNQKWFSKYTNNNNSAIKPLTFQSVKAFYSCCWSLKEKKNCYQFLRFINRLPLSPLEKSLDNAVMCLTKERGSNKCAYVTK